MPSPATSHRRIWLGYALLSVLAWLLYGVAGTDWQRGSRSLMQGLYEASWNVGLGLLIGALVFPWTQWLQRRHASLLTRCAGHAVGALGFAALWQGAELGLMWGLFGAAHAQATFEQSVIWRAAWAVIVYAGLVLGFGGALLGRRAQQEALRAAQAESALVRAELAVISGKLNPHFLFNTLNTLVMLTRRDPSRAESALLGFSRLMRYALDSTRHAHSRVSVREELAFVRDYLALEQLRLGDRLRLEWDIDPQAEDEEIPPLTLQPLVENAVGHGIAPLPQGGTLRISARRDAHGLHLRVADDGPGCVWPPNASTSASTSSSTSSGTPQGVGLAALQRRFELDFEGAARFTLHTAPGQGFAVHILIP